MDVATVIRSAPPMLELGSEPAASYRLDGEAVAIRAEAAPDAVATFPDEGLSVVPVASISRADEHRVVGPVYRMAGGALAVPTGRVLVRFEAGDSAEAHAGELATAGFRVEQILPYAPQAAWVHHADDGVAETLNKLGELAALAGVEHVEPQLISTAGSRS